MSPVVIPGANLGQRSDVVVGKDGAVYAIHCSACTAAGTRRRDGDGAIETNPCPQADLGHLAHVSSGEDGAENTCPVVRL